MKYLFFIFFSVFLFISFPPQLHAQSTTKDYHLISTCKDLESIGQGINYPGASHSDAWGLDESYQLINNIDCSATNPNHHNHDTTPETTYGDNGFNPIGYDYPNSKYSEQFTWLFDGNNYTISNLTIIDADYSITDVGLFGKVGYEGIIKNLSLENTYIREATGSVGAIAGTNYGLIKNCNVNGYLYSFSGIGGIVAYNEGTIDNCYSNSLIIGESLNGGIAIENSENAKIINCVSNSDIISNLGVSGGITALNHGVISNSLSMNNISGYLMVGGIAAINSTGTISNSYSIGNIIGEHQNIGGLVGTNLHGIINNCFTANNIYLDESTINAGGFIGNNSSIITNSFGYEKQIIGAQSINSDNLIGIDTNSPSSELSIATSDELNYPHWYTDVLYWNSDTWKIISGYYPLLYQIDEDGTTTNHLVEHQQLVEIK